MCSGQKHTEWTSEQDEILIDFVKNHECLYNIQCKDYRKSQLKQRLWHYIAQILQLTDIECSKRWGYVRDYYIRRRSRPGTGSSGQTAKKRSQQLAFLDTIASVKKSSLSNIEQCESQKNLKESSTANINEDENSMEQEPRQERLELLTDEETTNNILDLQQIRPDFARTALGKRNSAPTYTPADERLKILKQIAEQQDREKVKIEEDENDLFFKSMAKIIKSLPKAVQARLRMQVANLVGNAEIEHLSSSEHMSSSVASSITSNVTIPEDQMLHLNHHHNIKYETSNIIFDMEDQTQYSNTDDSTSNNM